MTGLDRNQTPKTRPMAQKRTALVASLDIGTSKIACMIARLKPSPPSDALRGRSHQELILKQPKEFGRERPALDHLAPQPSLVGVCLVRMKQANSLRRVR